MGGKTSQSTSSTTIPPEVLANYNAAFSRACAASKTPFTPYSKCASAFVAPLNATQQAATANVNNLQGSYQPSIQTGQNLQLQGLQSGTPLQYSALCTIRQGRGQSSNLYGQSLCNVLNAQAQSRCLLGSSLNKVCGAEHRSDQLYGQSVCNVMQAQCIGRQLYGQSLCTAQTGQGIGGQLYGQSLCTAGSGRAQSQGIYNRALCGIQQAGSTGQQYAQCAGSLLRAGIASASPYMQQAACLTGRGLVAGQQYAGSAGQYLCGGTRAISPMGFSNSAVNQYMSPYLQNVASSQEALMNQQNAIERSQLQGKAIMAGAFGGCRGCIAQANLAQQQQLANQATLSCIMNKGYGQGLATFQQQQGVCLSTQQANRAAQQFGAQQAAALGQQQYSQGLGASQQLQAIGRCLYSQNIGQGQAIAGLGQQQFGQGMCMSRSAACMAKSMYGMSAQCASLQQAAAQGMFGQAAQVAALQQSASQGMYCQAYKTSGMEQSAAQQMFNMAAQNAQMQQSASQIGFGQAAQSAGLQQAAAQGTFNQAAQCAAMQQSAGQNLFNMNQQAGMNYGNMGLAGYNAGLQGAQAQMGMGQIGQQTCQAAKQALYNQFQQQQGYPFQTSQFVTNAALGTGSLSGSTTTSTQPSSFFSDKRLKHDAEKIGETFDGMPIYSFAYNGDNRKQIGLMAQDVEKRHPHAVGSSHGYKTVDYDAATRSSADRGHFASGGLIPASSMGGLVVEPGAFASGGRQAFACGSRVVPCGCANASSDGNCQISGLYKSEFGRCADPSGLAYWQGQLQQGMSLCRVKTLMDQSPEYQSHQAAKPCSPQSLRGPNLTYCQAAFAPVGRPMMNQYGSYGANVGCVASGFCNRRTVEGLYQNVLGRCSDAAGAKYWSNAINSGTQPFSAVQNSFYQSPEFGTRYGYCGQHGTPNQPGALNQYGGYNQCTGMQSATGKGPQTSYSSQTNYPNQQFSGYQNNQQMPVASGKGPSQQAQQPSYGGCQGGYGGYGGYQGGYGGYQQPSYGGYQGSYNNYQQPSYGNMSGNYQQPSSGGMGGLNGYSGYGNQNGGYQQPTYGGMSGYGGYQGGYGNQMGGYGGMGSMYGGNYGSTGAMGNMGSMGGFGAAAPSMGTASGKGPSSGSSNSSNSSGHANGGRAMFNAGGRAGFATSGAVGGLGNICSNCLMAVMQGVQNPNLPHGAASYLGQAPHAGQSWVPQTQSMGLRSPLGSNVKPPAPQDPQLKQLMAGAKCLNGIYSMLSGKCGLSQVRNYIGSKIDSARGETSSPSPAKPSAAAPAPAPSTQQEGAADASQKVAYDDQDIPQIDQSAARGGLIRPRFAAGGMPYGGCCIPYGDAQGVIPQGVMMQGEKQYKLPKNAEEMAAAGKNAMSSNPMAQLAQLYGLGKSASGPLGTAAGKLTSSAGAGAGAGAAGEALSGAGAAAAADLAATGGGAAAAGEAGAGLADFLPFLFLAKGGAVNGYASGGLVPRIGFANTGAVSDSQEPYDINAIPDNVQAMSPDKGYNFDPHSEDLAIRTIASEMSGKNPDEAKGIANVILNRVNAKKWGEDPASVVLAKNQFEPWNDPNGSNYPMRHSSDSPRYIAAAAAWDAAKKGDNPIGGALNFYAPGTQKALNRSAPTWDTGNGIDIGATRFIPQNGETGPRDNNESADQTQVSQTQSDQSKRQASGKMPTNVNTGKAFNDVGDFLTSKQFILPALQGLGAMASSPSRYLGSALLQGLGAGAQAYQGYECKQANLGQVRAATALTASETAGNSFKMLGTMPMVRLTDGSWITISDYIKSPNVYRGKIAGGEAAASTADRLASQFKTQSSSSNAAPLDKPVSPSAETKPELNLEAVRPGVIYGDTSKKSASSEAGTQYGPQAAVVNAATARYFDGVTKDMNAAQASSAFLPETITTTSKLVSQGGVGAPGAYAALRTGGINTLNTLSRVFGFKDEKGNPVTFSDADENSALLAKANGLNSFATANGAGQDSLAALQAASRIFPSNELPPDTSATIAAQMAVNNAKAYDRYSHATRYAKDSQGPMVNAATSFDSDKTTSPDRYVNDIALMKQAILHDPQALEMMYSGKAKPAQIDEYFKRISDKIGVPFTPGMSRIFLGGRNG